MKYRIAKKISRHFWSRFLDPNNPRYKVSTVRKAVRIYNRQLKVKQKQAVQAGVAEWIVDKDGVVQFQWIKNKAGEE